MPVQSRTPVTAAAEQAMAELAARAASLAAASGGNLLECFAAVPAAGPTHRQVPRPGGS